jgi:hypothetical protein
MMKQNELSFRFTWEKVSILHQRHALALLRRLLFFCARGCDDMATTTNIGRDVRNNPVMPALF